MRGVAGWVDACARAQCLKNTLKTPNVQSFGIKFERIDRDLLWVYVTAVGRLYI